MYSQSPRLCADFQGIGHFNYAQGVMALFAAMTLVGVQEGQVPFAAHKCDFWNPVPPFRMAH